MHKYGNIDFKNIYDKKLCNTYVTCPKQSCIYKCKDVAKWSCLALANSIIGRRDERRILLTASTGKRAEFLSDSMPFWDAIWTNYFFLSSVISDIAIVLLDFITRDGRRKYFETHSQEKVINFFVFRCSSKYTIWPNYFFHFFFLRCPTRVWRGWDTGHVRICAELDTVCDPVTLHVMLLEANTARLYYHLSLSPCWTLQSRMCNPSTPIGKNDNASPRFTAASIHFFVVFFLIVFFFSFMLILTFIAAQMTAAAALSLKTESFAVMRPNALLDLIRCVAIDEIVAPRIRMSCSQHVASSGFMPVSPPANRFVSRVPGQNW